MSFTNLPTLYKKASTGKLQEWTIEYHLDTYRTRAGQVDGKITIGAVTTCKGKNIGKVNETSGPVQAQKEALAKWEKQKKKGYVESKADASEGLVEEEFVEGGVPPMLAEKFRDFSDKVKYPWFGQPKLDGHRGVFKDGKLWSRTRKPITSCVHIEQVLKDAGLGKYTLDGELYNHEYKDDFETLSSAIRKKDPLPPELQEVVQYHLYDIITDDTYDVRKDTLVSLYEANIRGTPFEKHIRIVAHEFVESEEDALRKEYFWRCRQGYEGYMLRNPYGLYQHKRTVDLQKVKVFQDAEFKIVGADEGKGKFAGHIAAFICEINDEHGIRTFKAGLKNVTADLQRAWFEDENLWMGKMATIEFLNYTRKNIVPRHGKWLRFRDMEF